MSALRPECRPATGDALARDLTLRLVLSSVSRRRSLAHGALHDGSKHCAMGCFFADNPNTAVYVSVLDEIATFNDLTPRATPKQRWRRMMRWLRERVEAL